jgi:serine/threonine-protein kinase
MKADDEIFGEAMELPESERKAFVALHCDGDDARLARIEALLSAHADASDFLERPLVDRGRFGAAEAPGTVIGRYTLVERIGEGGCGTVYLAEQQVPVRRRVALKIIKLGMDTRQVIARFQSERQALALMDHPDIARVLDADATAEGRPYFVMDLVTGVPIHRYCDEHRLNVTARLELFVRVCQALQHAHQKGIIHRDVKPSNILVADRDGAPAPKVIDFGIAKATQGRLTDQTLFTGVEQFIGTPSYMSPEQADLRDGDIDTRSDVYALGVLLYELLAGRLPFDPSELRGGVEHARNLICDVEPPRPSVRFAHLTDAERETVAGARSTTPTALLAQLRDDLDWIVMRCLEKQRRRRYGSAQELADDIRRHLSQEPIVARPPTVAYRTRRFVARHRLAVASAAAIALTLVAGTAISVRQAVRAVRAERVAKAERDAANEASRIATQAKADAQRRQEQAEDLLTFMLGNFRAELKNTRVEILDEIDKKALDYFASLEQKDLTDTVLTRQAKALYQIGETRTDEARYDDAAAAFTESYNRAAALTARHPSSADMLFERAQAEYWIGFIGTQRGDMATARSWLARYRESAFALRALEGPTVRAQHEVAYGYHNLAVLDFMQGELASAEQGLKQESATLESLLAANPEDVSLLHSVADAVSWLGSVADADGRYEDAVAHFREQAAKLEVVMRLQPHAARSHLKLTDCYGLMADELAIMGRCDEAKTYAARVIALREALLAKDPANRFWQQAAVRGRLNALQIAFTTGIEPGELKQLAMARDELEAIVQKEPTAKQFTLPLTLAWRLEAQSRLALHTRDAAAAASRAQELAERFVRHAGVENRMLGEYARACVVGGRIAAANGDAASARHQWLQALDVLGPRLDRSNDWRLLDPAAQALVLLGRTDEAKPLIERLRRFGYHSFDPLAQSLFADTFPPSTK